MRKTGEVCFAIGFSILFIGSAFLNIPMIAAGVAGMLAAGFQIEEVGDDL